MKYTDEHLIIFTRYPDPGRAKTRLIPLLGRQGAADLHRRMTERTLSCARRVSFLRRLGVEIRYDGKDRANMKAAFGEGHDGLIYTPQAGGDLGRRMGDAVLDAFGFGAKSVVIVGTDVPDLTERIINRAFDALNGTTRPAAARTDMVIGPARDGGYYLIGFANTVSERQIDSLFADIPWGTAGVLEETVLKTREMRLSCTSLDLLSDVDRPEDLSIWQRARRHEHARLSSRRISVIIPTLNEERTVRRAIQSAKKAGPDTEIIVVDAGSHDRTKAVAESTGARVIESPPPRSRQQNEGARAAGGSVLLFLHADTRLPRHYDRYVLDLLDDPTIVAGAFRLGIDGNAFSFRLVEFMANMRSRALQMPYGDQCLFVPRDLFYEVGGFPEIPIMDDFALVRRLQARGTIGIAPVASMTSPRRWRRLGVIRTTLINQFVVVSYLLGIPPEKIVGWYHREKGITARQERRGRRLNEQSVRAIGSKEMHRR